MFEIPNCLVGFCFGIRDKPLDPVRAADPPKAIWVLGNLEAGHNSLSYFVKHHLRMPAITVQRYELTRVVRSYRQPDPRRIRPARRTVSPACGKASRRIWRASVWDWGAASRRSAMARANSASLRPVAAGGASGTSPNGTGSS